MSNKIILCIANFVYETLNKKVFGQNNNQIPYIIYSFNLDGLCLLSGLSLFSF